MGTLYRTPRSTIRQLSTAHCTARAEAGSTLRYVSTGHRVGRYGSGPGECKKGRDEPVVKRLLRGGHGLVAAYGRSVPDIA
eukprot:3011271-Rhodomonas_salina.2